MKDETQRVGLFGATGGTGTHILRQSVARDLSLSALVRSPSKIDPAFSGHDLVNIIKGDFSDETAIEKIVTTSDTLICVAGNAKMSAAGPFMLPFVQTLVTQMRRHDVGRLVYQAGSFSIPPNQKAEWLLHKILRPTLGAAVGLSALLRENEEIMEWLSTEAKDIEWTVTRAGMLRNVASKGNLSCAKQASLIATYHDAAKITLDLALSSAQVHQFPGLTYSS